MTVDVCVDGDVPEPTEASVTPTGRTCVVVVASGLVPNAVVALTVIVTGVPSVSAPKCVSDADRDEPETTVESVAEPAWAVTV